MFNPALETAYRTRRANGYAAWQALNYARHETGATFAETLTRESAMRYAARLVGGVAIAARHSAERGMEDLGVEYWEVDVRNRDHVETVTVWLESGRHYGEY